MINIRFYKCSHYILLTKRYQSIYYISSHFLSTIPKTGCPDRNPQVTKKGIAGIARHPQYLSINLLIRIISFQAKNPVICH